MSARQRLAVNLEVVMDNAKVDEVLNKYVSLLASLGSVPDPFVTEKELDTRPEQRTYAALNHVLWMCKEALSWDQQLVMTGGDRLPKKMRWLGFIQGVLWMNNLLPVEQLKKDNMPKGEEYKS
jgi:hypothetical protein